MIYTYLTTAQPGQDAVRLVGVGTAGRRFVERLRTEAPPPLVELLQLPTQLHSGAAGARDDGDDGGGMHGVVILFVALALDATEVEVNVALTLMQRLRQEGGSAGSASYVIGILLYPEGNELDDHIVVDLESTANFIRGLDGRIGVDVRTEGLVCQSIGWLYAALRKLTVDGVLILEPAWDLQDVVEVLNLPGSNLRLATVKVAPAETYPSALDRAIELLVLEGVELEFAGGILMVLWHPASDRHSSREMRELTRELDQRFDHGVLQLMLRVTSHRDLPKARACMTLVISTWDGAQTLSERQG